MRCNWWRAAVAVAAAPCVGGFLQKPCRCACPRQQRRQSTPATVAGQQTCHRRHQQGAWQLGAAAAGDVAAGEQQEDDGLDVWVGFDAGRYQQFLREYWQKKPLLVRQAFRDFVSPLSPDELAGLACADEVESRIVTGGAEPGNGDWTLRHGPFEESVFDEEELTGGAYWTLLVNEVNRHVPEVSDLLTTFCFVPNWRVDDVMISYAPQGGSVGPHVDSYDVFLLQGSGAREWSIEGHPITNEEELDRLVPDIDVRVLEGFKPERTWVLRAGDMLYLPPRWAHHGVSMDDECTTISIGFRAPAHRDLITFFTDAVASQRVPAGAMYQDPDLALQQNPGLVAPEAIARARDMVRSAVMAALDEQDPFFEEWFGAYVTRSRRDHSGYPVPLEPDEISTVYSSPSAVVAAMKRAADAPSEEGSQEQGPFLYRSEGLTFAYVEHTQGKKPGTTLFIDGHSFHLGTGMAFAAQALCRSPRVAPSEIGHHLSGPHAGDLSHLLQRLLLAGYLYAADD